VSVRRRTTSDWRLSVVFLVLVLVLLLVGCRKESSTSTLPTPAVATESDAGLAPISATAVEVAPAPPLEPTAAASSSATTKDAATAAPPPPPTCIADKPPQVVHVWFETRIVPLPDAPKVKVFRGFIRISELKIDKEVFADSADNCKSCRAKPRDTSLDFHCGGDMASGDGKVTLKDGVITIESNRGPAAPNAPKDIEYRALACGSKAVFHSTTPDPDKKPVTGCE
jgi:hypothetical protein